MGVESLVSGGAPLEPELLTDGDVCALHVMSAECVFRGGGGGGGTSTVSPLHRENRGNYPKVSVSGNTKGIEKFCQNTGKTQGMLFAQETSSLILKIQDIAIFF